MLPIHVPRAPETTMPMVRLIANRMALCSHRSRTKHPTRRSWIGRNAAQMKACHRMQRIYGSSFRRFFDYFFSILVEPNFKHAMNKQTKLSTDFIWMKDCHSLAFQMQRTKENCVQILISILIRHSCTVLHCFANARTEIAEQIYKNKNQNVN